MAFPTDTADSEILQQNPQQNPQENPNQETPEDIPVEEPPDEDEVNDILLELVKTAEKEDLDLRYPLLHVWKRNTYYFNNIQAIFFDPIARDYRTINAVMDDLLKNGTNVDIKIINVYRAWAESIIAALSVEVPAVEFNPDDAENPDDLETADAYTRIATIILKHNHAALMLIKALTILYNQGTVFAHNDYKRDPAYGEVVTPKTVAKREVPTLDLRCSVCGYLLESNLPQNFNQQGAMPCPNCGQTSQPQPFPQLHFEEEVTEWESTAKGRSEFDIYGPTYVKASLYATKQSEVPYLILREEGHIAKYRSRYNDFDLEPGGQNLEDYERWARVAPEYSGGIPKDITTCRYAYFRPWYYYTLGEEKATKLQSLYPNGVKVAVIKDTILEKDHCKLDEEWTISFDPRSEHIHAEPAGNVAIPIQDAETDVFNLGLQCIEYGIPETFANPKTLNFNKYSQQQSNPGMITAALPPGPDKAISDGFHTIKTATLSGEYSTFEGSLKAKGEFITGAMPSIWGGISKTGVSTATETQNSRAQALQRLQITYRMIKVFWSQMVYKSCVLYAKNLLEDERFSDKKNGSYVNIWVHKSELNGKVGQVEPDMNEQLPQSWAQRRDFISHLIELNIPEVSSVIMHPNNSEILKDYTAIPDLYIPGENDRNKQWSEFYKMSEGQQVNIDLVVDDHAVHMQVLKNILVSPVGLSLLPNIYAECIQHYRQHELAIQAKTAAPSGMTQPGEPTETATPTTQG